MASRSFFSPRSTVNAITSQPCALSHLIPTEVSSPPDCGRGRGWLCAFLTWWLTLQDLVHRGLGAIDVLRGDDQGRHETDRVVVDRIDGQPRFEAGLLECLGSRFGELDRLHEAEAAYFLAAETVDGGVQHLPHLGCVPHPSIALDDIQHCQRGRACEPGGTEGGTALPRLES